MHRPGNEGRFANVSAALLAGGPSSRMGRDKACVPIAGVAAATRTAQLLDSLFDDLLIVGGQPPDAAPGRRVADPDGPRCALRGVVAALGAARGERVLVVATDLPLLTPDLLLALVAWPEADAVVPRPDGQPQPLCALYARDRVLPIARARLDEGQLALRGLLDAVATGYLEGDDLAGVDPEATALTHANTLDEWRAAEALLAARG